MIDIINDSKDLIEILEAIEKYKDKLIILKKIGKDSNTGRTTGYVLATYDKDDEFEEIINLLNVKEEEIEVLIGRSSNPGFRNARDLECYLNLLELYNNK